SSDTLTSKARSSGRKPSAALIWGLSALFAASAVTGSAWLQRHRPTAEARSPKGAGAAPRRDPALQSLIEAYQGGRYKEAGTAAKQMVAQTKGPRAEDQRRWGLEARPIPAYSAARRGDFPLARQHFDALRQAAYETPDHGKQQGVPGERLPTLEEE